MAIYLPVILTPLACSDLKDNQFMIDKINKENEGKDPVDHDRVPELEHWYNVTYLSVQDEKIGDTEVETRIRTDCKFYGHQKPKIGIPQIFQAKLVEWNNDNQGGRAALSYKLMKLLKAEDVGIAPEKAKAA